ncbi:MAG: stage III sporulation AC/AD family protein [Ruminococcus sp.]|nr:stage III sporulation AC/AD family protein [Ruminococcus sp.]
MVDNCFSVAVFCTASALLAVLLRQYSREQAMLTALGACGAVLCAFALTAEPMISEIEVIFGEAGISQCYISLIFKAAAICFITQMTCEICRDCGETAIGSAAELWGRGAITFMSLPVVRALVELINGIV